MEQFVRDARIAMIYEGANGIQALDLVGRKLPKDGGRALTAFFAEVNGFLSENKEDEALAPYLAPVKAALGQLQQATMWLMQNGMKNPDNAGAASTDYMHLFGLVALSYMWGRIAKAVLAPSGGRNEHPGARRQASARALLQRARAAGGGRASGPHHERRRAADGAGGGGVLSVRLRNARLFRRIHGQRVSMRGCEFDRPFRVVSSSAWMAGTNPAKTAVSGAAAWRKTA